MKYRKDITNYLVSQLGDQYKKKDYKFYEQEGLLYLIILCCGVATHI